MASGMSHNLLPRWALKPRFRISEFTCSAPGFRVGLKDSILGS